jgi:PilZ domain
MSGSPTPFARRSLGVLARIAPDRRRHQRLAVTPLGRCMRANKQAYPCRRIDASAGAAGILSPVGVEVAARVLANFEHLDGIEGPVVRGFASIEATHNQREKLAAELTWPANRADMTDAAERPHERSAPANSVSQLALAEGVALACKALDVASSGACIKTRAPPEIGTKVRLGKLRARVMRHRTQGFGVEFIDIQNRPRGAAILVERVSGFACSRNRKRHRSLS